MLGGLLDHLLSLRLPHGTGDAARIRRLRDEALGFRIGNVQKRAFDEIKGLRVKGALSDAPITSPLQTNGAWPRYFRPTTVL